MLKLLRRLIRYLTILMTSPVDRKPLATYKSPTPGEQIFIPRTVLTSKSKQSSTTTSKSSTKASRSSKDTPMQPISRKSPHTPPLPLFHPLGHLAMSLPPLDPTLYGLPLLSIPDEIEERQSRHSSKQLVVKTRDVEEELPTPTVSAVAAVAARETKDRASPRKRRNGGGPKRKRKDVEERE